MSAINIMRNSLFMRIMVQQDMTGLPIHKNITMEQGILLMNQLKNSL